jgi:type II secretory pathway predicted ATPase ExeA
VNVEITTSNQLIETQNVRAVKSAVKNAVQNNRIALVEAEVGSGKTTLFNHLAEYWEQYPHRFRIPTIKGFDMRRSRASVIIRLLLGKLNPQADIPVSIEMMYKLLEQELRSFCKPGNNRVILMIDEAQDMPFQTFRDIKKIHEISGPGREHLISVILFGKQGDRKLKRYINTNELGFRTHYLLLSALNNEDLLKIAEQKYGLRFENSRVRERFGSTIQFKTPLGVEFFARALRNELGIEDSEPAVVSAELASKIPMITIKYKLRQAGISQAKAADYVDKAIPNKKMSPQRMNEFLNGKLNDEELERQATLVLEKMLNNLADNRHVRVSGDE